MPMSRSRYRVFMHTHTTSPHHLTEEHLNRFRVMSLPAVVLLCFARFFPSIYDIRAQIKSWADEYKA
eukprot:g41144.t1